MMPATAIEHYLTRYAEDEAKALGPLFNQLNQSHHTFSSAITIALYDESAQKVSQLLKQIVQQSDAALIILVVNAPTPCDDDGALLRTRHLLNQLKNLIQVTFSNATQTLSFGTIWSLSGHGVLIIDRCLNGACIPKKQGVGLARKIAVDCALAFYQQQTLRSPWIHCTDADVELPNAYFNCIKELDSDQHYSALIYPFAHVIPEDPILDQARLTYELYLYHYVNGLKSAKSPYACQTTGSLLVVNAFYYSKVRGFPKRSGAEDFYLLNKLIKQAPILSLARPVITLATRLSERVPFGTGPALTKLMQHNTPFEEPMFYPDSVFNTVKICLNCMTELVTGEAKSQSALITRFKDGIADLPKRQQQLLVDYFEQIQLFRFIETIQVQYKSNSQRLTQLHTFFDGFRTLKLVRYSASAEGGLLSLRQWLDATDSDNETTLSSYAKAKLIEYQSITESVQSLWRINKIS